MPSSITVAGCPWMHAAAMPLTLQAAPASHPSICGSSRKGRSWLALPAERWQHTPTLYTLNLCLLTHTVMRTVHMEGEPLAATQGAQCGQVLKREHCAATAVVRLLYAHTARGCRMLVVWPACRMLQKGLLASGLSPHGSISRPDDCGR